ncbi:unnamed protein product [Lactuca saligna]|uniref:DUF4283 domain-containing protein n=1 Tax=Lactuca saligna TaxID=75948 RepID=A0AA35VKJ4_LACSI|nr:unnamed protein product [Lactuca saligna]
MEEQTRATKEQGKERRTSFRDHRTYADMMRPTHTTNPHIPSPKTTRPLNLHRKLDTLNWLRKTIIVGEAMSLDHLENLPKLLRPKGESSMEIKYIGGLRVLILFDYSVAAKEFMENECRWKQHLKWLRWGDKTETHAERVAWIRIMGLPLHLWGQRNFKTITSVYGKTIAPFKDIPHRVDLSHVKIGILTKNKIRIYDEVTSTFKGKEYRLGIIEFDEGLFPFTKKKRLDRRIQ